MTDNITVNPGVEDNRVSVATDEVDQIHYPVYKMAIGADGEAALISNVNAVPIVSGVEDVDRSLSLQQTLEHILDQQKIMNMHLAIISGTHVTESDIDV
jgi:hypothetical protein